MKYELGHQQDRAVDGEVVIRLVLQHFYGLGITQRFPMQSCQIGTQASVFTFYSSHISLTHNLVPRRPAGAATMMNFKLLAIV